VGSLGSGDEGAGTRMLWFPSWGLSVLVACGCTQWDQDNIGQYSAAFGYKTTAPDTIQWLGENRLVPSYIFHRRLGRTVGRGFLDLGDGRVGQVPMAAIQQR